MQRANGVRHAPGRPAQWAADYVGEDYGTGGCWLLMRDVRASKYGEVLPDLRPAEAIAIEFCAALEEWRRWRRVDQPEEGDLVLMWRAGRAQHCGVYAGGGHVLHHEDGAGAVCVPLRGLPVEGYYRRVSRD